MAYVLLLEEVYRRAAADIQAALIAQAMGSQVEIPDLAAIRDRFDQLLAAEPAGLTTPTSREAQLRELFGLSGG